MMITKMNIRSLLFVFYAVFSVGLVEVQANTPNAATNNALSDWGPLDHSKLKLASQHVLVVDTETGKPIYAKNPSLVSSIASITKLMTAMVVLDANLPLDEPLTINLEDLDVVKGTHSRLRLGAELTRQEMLRLALMSSENRAASVLGRSYPGGLSAFVTAMNIKAKLLGMSSTRFVDSSGLSPQNVSTAEDLVKLVNAASEYPLIHEFTTTASHTVEIAPHGYTLGYQNTNSLVKNDTWDILVSKTGFIQEAGRCLVMLAKIASRPIAIVLLDSIGKNSRIADAIRVRQWLEGKAVAVTSLAEPQIKAKAKKKTRSKRK